MLLYYIRHGDPIYTPDHLTPLGERQAEALARRLATFGLDRIYSSPSIRALQTARPTCELLNMTPIELPAFDESLAYQSMYVLKDNGKRCWPWTHPEIRGILLSREVREMGYRWHEHPALTKFRDFMPGINRIAQECDAWLASIGCVHDTESGRYVLSDEIRDARIALFAHEGVGKLLLSHLLDIPFPLYAMNFEIEHSGMTVVEFRTWKDDTCNARVLTLSNDSHLYREGLPLDYKHEIRF